MSELGKTETKPSTARLDAAQPTAEATAMTAALDEVFAFANRSDAPGMVVGVAQRGRIVYRRGFGLANVALGVANTPATLMRIGSTSKHFTCLAALLLAEESRLDVDAPVRTYLPELPQRTVDPSLRQLMTHTSGYRCHVDLSSLSDGLAVQPRGAGLATMVRQSESNFEPGESQLYCNGGYHLLSLAIERASGMRFEQFMQERIFGPMGMVDTASVPCDFRIHRGLATLHVPQPAELGGGWRLGVFPSEEILGEGAMVSTVDDMLRWLAHLRGPKTVGSAESWRQMLSTATLNNGLQSVYSLGLMQHLYRGVKVIHHAGAVVGGSCQMLTVPDHELDVVLMANGLEASMPSLANKVVDAVLGDAALAAAEARVAGARFQPMLGSCYRDPGSGMVVGFAETPEGQLGLSLFRRPPVALRDEGDLLRIGFEDLAAGPFVVETSSLATEGAPPGHLRFSEAGCANQLELISGAPPGVEEAAPALVGRYHAADLGVDACLTLETAAGRRCLKLQTFGSIATPSVELLPLSPDVFALQGDLSPGAKAHGVLCLVRESDGRITGFHVNSLRSRHVLFKRLAEA